MSMLKTLVGLGADINQPDAHDETALLIAVKHDQIETVKELLSLGAKPTEKEIAAATKGSKVKTLLEAAKTSLEIGKGMRELKEASASKTVNNSFKGPRSIGRA